MPFEHESYKSCLRHWLATHATKRGNKAGVAKALRIHPPYLSQVVSGAANMSVEQGYRFCRFAAFVPLQTNYFMILLQRDRAGTAELRDFYDEQLEKLGKKRFSISDRLPVDKNLSSEDQAIYYSSWLYSAVHAMASIPRIAEAKTIATCLHIPLEKIVEVTEFLVLKGLLTRGEDGLQVGKTRLHLKSDSPFISQFHRNWRLACCQNLDRAQPSDMHYSSAVSISSKDADRIRGVLLAAISDVKEIVRPSKDESAFVFSADFFQLA